MCLKSVPFSTMFSRKCAMVKHEHRLQVPTIGCGMLDRILKVEIGALFWGKIAFCIVSLDSIDCSLDSENKDKGPKTFGIVLEFLRRMTSCCKHTVRSMTSSNLILHVCETRKFVMAILHGKQGL